MINRRCIRIKVFQTLYSNYTNKEYSINKIEKELFISIEKSFSLQFFSLKLFSDLINFETIRIENIKEKIFATKKEMNPDKKFVNNLFIKQIFADEEFKSKLGKTNINWINQDPLILSLYKKLKQSNLYLKYMERQESVYNEDKLFVINFLRDILLQDEEFFNAIEEESLFWNDEVEYLIESLIKTIDRCKVNKITHLVMFKDDEDEKFARNLLFQSLSKHNELQTQISEYANNWDIKRIAVVDVLLLELAITEFLYFPSIPIKVTIDEYLEIARFYSTEKSPFFINGILDKFAKKLIAENKLNKIGRGLI